MYSYLASPYTHEDPAVREDRYRAAMAAVASLLETESWVYSPIVHCHELAIKHNLPKEFSYWWDYNAAMLERASRLIVLNLAGWKESLGIREEMKLAHKLFIPVTYMEPV